MIAIVRLALRRPYTFIVMAILIVIFGGLAAIKTPTDIFPDIRIPVIAAVWTYRGMSPDDMAGRVIYYYERQLSTAVNDIEHIESQSLPGVGIVKIFFQPTVDIRTATAQVTSLSQTVLKQMPPGITPPLILNYNASTVPILELGLSSPALPEQDIYDLGQNFIRPSLASVPGSAIPSPYGGKERQIQIDLDPQKLEANNLSGEDLENALAAQNQIIPAGTIKVGDFEYNVKLNNSPSVIDDLNRLPIKQVNGATIYMGDVAHVRDGFPPQRNEVRMDGHRGVLMTVLKSGSASTLDIVDNVKALLPRLKQTLPKSLKVVALDDQSIFVRAALSGVIKEGAIAASLTSLMILLFLGSWRSTLVIVISIPLAILFSIAALSALGQTLNIMTIGGAGPRGWHIGGRRHCHNREHQLAFGKEETGAAGDLGRCAADRSTSLCIIALYLHCFSADVLFARHFRLSFYAHGRSRGVCIDRLLYPVAHAGAYDGELLAGITWR